MKVVALVQARLDSDRLPGKVLADLAGESLLSAVVRRACEIPLVREVVVCTTQRSADEGLRPSAVNADIAFYADPGEPADVLHRLAVAAQRQAADLVVRLTADCPFLDPMMAGAMIASYATQGGVLVNTPSPIWADGLDVEVFAAGILYLADSLALAPEEREHVTPWIRANSRVSFFPAGGGVAEVFNRLPAWARKWSVDTAAELRFARAMARRLRAHELSWRDTARAALAVVQQYGSPEAIPEQEV